jgi:hypothetical protein
MQKRIGSLLLLVSCLAYATATRAGILYKNGPVNGICDIESCQGDAWLINYGNSITNSFSCGGQLDNHGYRFRHLDDLWRIAGLG